MLINDVVMGKTIKLINNDESLMEVRICIEMFPGTHLESQKNIATARV